MQELIEEAVRAIGWGALRLLTLGRYRGGRAGDRLAEGAIGLAVVLVLMYAGYAMTV